MTNIVKIIDYNFRVTAAQYATAGPVCESSAPSKTHAGLGRVSTNGAALFLTSPAKGPGVGEISPLEASEIANHPELWPKISLVRLRECDRTVKPSDRSRFHAARCVTQVFTPDSFAVHIPCGK